VRLVGFIIRIYHDARSHGRQIKIVVIDGDYPYVTKLYLNNTVKY